MCGMMQKEISLGERCARWEGMSQGQGTGGTEGVHGSRGVVS